MGDEPSEVLKDDRARAWGMLLRWFMRTKAEQDPTALKNAIASLMGEARADAVRDAHAAGEAKAYAEVRAMVEGTIKRAAWDAVDGRDPGPAHYLEGLLDQLPKEKP